MGTSITVSPGLQELVRSLFPGAHVASAELMGPDVGAGRNQKSIGYGQPILLTIDGAAGRKRQRLVFHTALPNELGHDRRADRADEILLAWDTTHGFPRHVEPVDVGFMEPNGRFRSIVTAGEPYLITAYAEGTPYSQDLRRIVETGEHTGLDIARVEAMAAYLVELHSERHDAPAVYRRAVRDLIGHGEGIFGIVDVYGTETAGAPARRLEAIEHACVAWRWRLRGRESRLRRTHGDFHPFNVIFREGTDFSVLDASRGARGEPADDVAAMAINFVFFAIEQRGAWSRGLGPLWRRFWDAYLTGSRDDGLLSTVAPFLAWRGLVVACPKFYPQLSAGARDAILGFVERALDAPRFDPASAEALFR